MSARLPLLPPSRPSAPQGRILDFDPSVPHEERPRLVCPLRPELGSHVHDAHAHAHAWVVQMGLVGATEAGLERCLAARFAWLGARAYPKVSRDELHIVVDWLSFLFFYDDLCDTRAVQERVYRADLEALEDRLIAVAHGDRPAERDDALVLALGDIRSRLAGRACDGWLVTFADRFAEYIDGVRWERIARLEARVPSPAVYARMRPLSSAVYPCLDLAAIFIDGSDPHFTRGTYVRQLETMTNNHVSWVNDVHGVDKEIREQTHANLVIVSAHAGWSSWDDALDRAIEACNAELAGFLELAQIVRARGDRRVSAYVDAMASWMRGNLDWYADTRRYAR